jgi:hypothetical protein
MIHEARVIREWNILIRSETHRWVIRHDGVKTQLPCARDPFWIVYGPNHDWQVMKVSGRRNLSGDDLMMQTELVRVTSDCGRNNLVS